MMVNAIMMTEKEAMYVQVLSSTGMAKASIATRFGYKLMDVVNVLRGNSFSHVTGILNRNITGKEVVVVEHLLKQEHPYRDIAGYAGIDANKVRNIMGVAQFNKVI